MGVRGQSKLINAKAPGAIELCSFRDFNNSFLAIDALMQLYRYRISIRRDNGGDDLKTSTGLLKSHIVGTYYKILKCIYHKIWTVWVFDNVPPLIKARVLQKRRNDKLDAINKLNKLDPSKQQDKEEYIKLMKKSCYIDSKQIQDIQQLLDLIGVPNIQAPYGVDAEAQCAALSPYIVSNDWDTLLFGGRVMIKNLSSHGNIEKVSLHKLLEELNLTLPQFIDISIILGTDYCEHIKGISPTFVYEKYKDFLDLKQFVEYLINENAKYEKPRYIIPENFLVDAKIAKEYFLSTHVVDKNDNIVDLKWREPDRDGLIDFLCNKFEFSRFRTTKEVDRIVSIYKQNKNLFIPNLIAQGA